LPDINNMIIFMTASLALNITPGPDMLYVITRSAAEGKRSGIVSSLGISSGTIIHILAVALGLSAFLLAVPTAYDIIRYTGAAYLLYLGIRTLTKKNTTAVFGNEQVKKNLHSVYWQGFLTNLFNPKVALFFLAFLPQFIDPSGNIPFQVVMLGIMFNISGTIVNVAVAFTASRLGKILNQKLNNSSVFKWITGSVFIALGIRLALLERK
jgi:threonine/homoserine/homoserine lactone efflux protein